MNINTTRERPSNILANDEATPKEWNPSPERSQTEILKDQSGVTTKKVQTSSLTKKKKKKLKKLEELLSYFLSFV